MRGDRCRRGVGTTAVALLVRAGFVLAGARRLEIRTSPGAIGFLRIAERLGFTRDGVVRSGETIAGEPRDMTIWTQLRAEYVEPPTPWQALDALGRRLR